MIKHNIESNFLDQHTFESLTCGNCWCMYYRFKKLDFKEGKVDDGNKRAMKEIVWENKPTRLLGVYEGQAIAWCAFKIDPLMTKIFINLHICF